MFLTFLSCKKEKPVSLDVSRCEMAAPGAVYGITDAGPSGILCCGGSQGNSGFIMQSCNGGESWSEVYTNDTACLYTIERSPEDLIWCGGDRLILLRSIDYGREWTNELGGMDFSGWAEFITAIRTLVFFDSIFFAAGGDYYYKGIFFRSYNRGWWWEFMNFDNEFDDVAVVSENTALLAGYGCILKSNDKGKSWTRCDVDDDHFTGLHFIDGQLGFACGTQGRIYKTADAGTAWETIYKEPAGSKEQFNDIVFTDALHGYACGNNGLLVFTSDGGSHWMHSESFTTEHLLCLSPYGSEIIFAGGSGGGLYRISQ